MLNLCKASNSIKFPELRLFSVRWRGRELFHSSSTLGRFYFSVVVLSISNPWNNLPVKIRPKLVHKHSLDEGFGADKAKIAYILY